jgi:hypothetical protein
VTPQQQAPILAECARTLAEDLGRTFDADDVTAILKMRGITGDKRAEVRLTDMTENLLDEVWRDYDRKQGRPSLHRHESPVMQMTKVELPELEEVNRRLAASDPTPGEQKPEPGE